MVEAVSSAVSAEPAVYQGPGTSLAQDRSASFGYHAAGESIVAQASVPCSHHAVDEVLAFGTARPFVYVSAGESGFLQPVVLE